MNPIEEHARTLYDTYRHHCLFTCADWKDVPQATRSAWLAVAKVKLNTPAQAPAVDLTGKSGAWFVCVSARQYHSESEANEQTKSAAMQCTQPVYVVKAVSSFTLQKETL